MKKFIVLAVLMVCIAGVAFAGAWKKDGVLIDKSDIVNIVNGPAVSDSGTATKLDFSTMSGSINWSGTNIGFTGINWTDKSYMCVDQTGVIYAGSTCP